MADDGDSVVVVLNAEVCIGVGNCELLQPAHFRIDDDTAVAEMIGDGAMSPKAADELVDRCPSGALSIATPSDR